MKTLTLTLLRLNLYKSNMQMTFVKVHTYRPLYPKRSYNSCIKSRERWIEFPRPMRILEKLDSIEKCVESLLHRLTELETSCKKNEAETLSLTKELVATQIELEAIKQKVNKLLESCKVKEDNHLHSLLIQQAKVCVICRLRRTVRDTIYWMKT